MTTEFATLAPLLPLGWSAEPQEDGTYRLYRTGALDRLAAWLGVSTEWRVGPNLLERRTRLGRRERTQRLTDATLRLFAYRRRSRVQVQGETRWSLVACHGDTIWTIVQRSWWEGDPKAPLAETRRFPELDALSGWLAVRTGWRLSAP